MRVPSRSFFTSPSLYNQRGGDPKRKPTIVPEQPRMATTNKGAVVPQAQPRTVVRQPESLDDIKVGISKLLDEEIESVKENALAIETQQDIVKQFLARTKFEVTEGKEGDVIMKRIHGDHVITVTFNKDEPVDDEVDSENEPNAAEEEDGKEADASGQEAEAAGGTFPQKQAVNIEVAFSNKPLKWILGGFAGKDNRLYIEDMSLATEEQTKKMAETPVNPLLKESTAPPSVDAIPFESLADNLQDRIYDFLDEIGVDDQLAHFIKVYTVTAEAKTAVKFLENLKEVIKPM